MPTDKSKGSAEGAPVEDVTEQERSSLDDVAELRLELRGGPGWNYRRTADERDARHGLERIDREEMYARKSSR